MKASTALSHALLCKTSPPAPLADMHPTPAVRSDHQALLPTLIEAPLEFEAPARPPALAEALQAMQQTCELLRDVAAHKHARKVVATQAHLEEAMAGAGQAEGLGG